MATIEMPPPAESDTIDGGDVLPVVRDLLPAAADITGQIKPPMSSAGR